MIASTLILLFELINGFCSPPLNINYSIRPLSITECADLGEGPHWDHQTGQLYYVDAFVGNVYRYDLRTHLYEKFIFNDLVTVVIPIDRDNSIVSLRNKIVKFNWTHKTTELIAVCAAEHNGRERFNDGKIDPMGRLWIGTVLENSDGTVKKYGGSLYRLEHENRRFRKMAENFTLSNGMAWNVNNTLMYFNDSEDRKIWQFDFNVTTGTISNRCLFIDLDQDAQQFKPNEYPDGMTIDSKDFIWIALYNGGRIVRIDPNTRQISLSIAIPALRTTSLTFGGPNLDQIFVTTGAHNIENGPEPKKYPMAGKIFQIKFNQNFNNETLIQGRKAFQLKLL